MPARLFRGALAGVLLFPCISIATAADSGAALDANLAAARNAAEVTRLTAVRNLRQTIQRVPDVLRALTLLLHDKSADIRANAARGLGELGPTAAESVRELAPLLADRSADVRLAAATAIGTIGFAPIPGGSNEIDAGARGEIVCALSSLLNDESATVRSAAADTLGNPGIDAAPVLELLREHLSDPDSATAVSSALSLAAHGEIQPERAGLYVRGLERVGAARALASKVLLSLGSVGAEALAKELTPRAEDKGKERAGEPFVRREAATLLARFGPQAAPALDALRGALSDPDGETQNCAARSLLKLDVAPVAAIPAFVRMLRDEGGATRVLILRALERMPPGAEAVPLSLLDMLHPADPKAPPDAALRREAARALTAFAPRFATPAALPLLVAVMGDPDPTARQFCVQALRKSGATADVLIPVFTSALKDKSPEVRAEACGALVALSPHPAALLVLAELRAGTDDATLRNEAGRAVLAAGSKALPALPVARAALSKSDVYLRIWSCELLGNLGPAAAEAVPELCASLVKFNEGREETVLALGRIGAPAVAGLLPLLTSPNDPLSNSASRALALIGAPAIDPLTKYLADDEHPDRACAASYALERMAPASAPALPAMMAALRSKNPKIQDSVVVTVARLGAAAGPALIQRVEEEGHLPEDSKIRKTGIVALSMTGGTCVDGIAAAIDAADAKSICVLAEVLGRIGTPGAPALPALLRATGRPYENKERSRVWSQCATALGRIGVPREDAVALLFSMFDVKDPEAQSSAASALQRLGSEAMRVPPLTEALRQAAPSTLGHALKAFGSSAWRPLLAELENPAPEIRDAAAAAFLPLAPECERFLLQALEDHPDARLGAILALGEISAQEAARGVRPPPAKPTPAKVQALADAKALNDAVVAALQKIAQGENPTEAVAAVWALGKAAGNGSETIALLVKHLPNCAGDVRVRGLEALNSCELKGQARLLAPLLPLLLKTPAEGTGDARGAGRQWVAKILKTAGFSAESVPALLDGLEEPDDFARSTARNALAGMGADAQSAIPRLVTMLAEDTQQANSAAQVLKALEPQSVPALIEALKLDNVKARQQAFNLLEGAKLEAYVPQLAVVLEAKAEDVVVPALHLLRKLGVAARPAESRVRALLSEPGERTFYEAVEVLKSSGVEVAAAVLPSLDSKDDDIVLRAASVLNNPGVLSPAATPAVAARLLKHRSADVRTEGVSLFHREPVAPEALPLILIAAKDADSDVRVQAMNWFQVHAKTDLSKAIPALLAGLNDESERVSNTALRAMSALGADARPAVPELLKLMNSPNKAVRQNAAEVLFKLGEGGPEAARIHFEAVALIRVRGYNPRQLKYFEDHWTDEHVHYYAQKLAELYPPAVPGEEQAGKKRKSVPAEPPKFAEDGTMQVAGYNYRVLYSQTAHAPGGKKEWLRANLLSGGHALAAWPAEPGVTGNLIFLSGPTGAIFQRELKPEQFAQIPALLAAYEPTDDWTLIFEPEKVPLRVQHDYFKPQISDPEALEF